MEFQLWQPYLISAAVGLLVGIEREKAHPGGKAMGVRTFLMVALSGALAGGVDLPWLSAILAIFALSLIAISYFNTGRSPDADHGLTTEFAAGIVFTLGYVSHEHPVLTSVIAPLITIVLFSKSTIHRFTDRIKASEFQAALMLLLVATTVINMLEDKVIDPWGIFNPRKFGILILILGAMQFVSYVVTKIMGEKKGALVVGFLGGLVSSTAVLLSSARDSLKAKKVSSLVMTVVGSQIASLGQLLFIVAMVSMPLFWQLALPIGSTIAVAAVILGFYTWKASNSRADVPLRSPLDWRGVLRLAVVFALMLAGIAVANKFFGESGSSGMSILAGIFELHGVTLANSTIFANQQMSLASAELNILLAATASLAGKTVIAWVIARNRFAYSVGAVFLLLIVVLWLAQWIH